MGNTHHNINKKSVSHLLWQLTSRVTLGAISSLYLATSAQAEGSFQINNNSDSNQRLYDYDARVNVAGTTFLEPFDRPLYVDVLRDNEIINVLACVDGRTNIQVEIFKVNTFGASPNVISGDVLSTSVVNRTLTGGNIAGGCDENADITAAASVIAANPVNNNQGIVTYAVNPSGGGLGTGTYRIHLRRVGGDGLVNTTGEVTGFNETIRLFDVSISTTTTPIPNPSAIQGRLWSYNWGFNAGGFGNGNTTNQNYYIVTPSNLSTNPFIWLLDMEEVAGFVYEIMANERGVDSPNDVGRNVAGLSVPYSETNDASNLQNGVTPQFRQYLSRPAVFPGQPSADPVVIQNFRFEDNAGEDNTISPNITGGTQDSGFFRFTTNDPGTYVITIDIDDDGDETNGFNPDGVFGVGDVSLRGETVNGELSVAWNGTSTLGTVLPTGVYPARLLAVTGEYHFVATDIEHSGPAGGGITIFDGSGSSPVPTSVFWDDRTGIQFDQVNTNQCAPLPADPNCSSLPDGFPSDGTRHRWGTQPTGGGFSNSNQSSAQFGNLRFLDTYVYGGVSLSETPAVIISDSSVPNPDDPRQDYGDAPDTYSTNITPGDDGVTNSDLVGAAHSLPLSTEFIQLGANAPDGEEDPDLTGVNATNALGDDSGGSTPDDEDGVASFDTLTVSDTSYSVTVNVRNSFANSGATTEEGYLVGWIDFNRDGVFDASEGTVFDRDPGTAGIQGIDLSSAVNDNTNVTLTWNGLSGLVAGDTYARFRVSTDRNLVTDISDNEDTSKFFGAFIDGEVEDYQITIDPPILVDYGDAPGDDDGSTSGENNYQTTAASGGPFHTINANLRLGLNAPDPDDGTLQDLTATADDTTDTDGDGTPDENDEDGVDLLSLALNATSYEATVKVTNTTGGDAYLVGWIDFNQNGEFETSEGQLLDFGGDPSNGITPIPTGTTDTDVTLTWTGLSGSFAEDNNIFARFRITDTVLTDANGTQSVGALGIGEVEDYKLVVGGEANLLLVKRITAVRRNGSSLGVGDRPGGQDTSIFNDLTPSDATNDIALVDNNPNWPTNDDSYLSGAWAAGTIQSGDEVEYTIYFLNAGGSPVSNVTICDVVPTGMTYVANSMELFLDQTGTTEADLDDPSAPDAGNLLTATTTPPNSLSDLNDGDRGTFFAPGENPIPSNLCRRGATPIDGAQNDTGAVVYNVVDSTNPATLPDQIDFATAPGTPPSSYGFVRFRAVLD